VGSSVLLSGNDKNYHASQSISIPQTREAMLICLNKAVSFCILRSLYEFEKTAAD
jgi:hypothetical protein